MSLPYAAAESRQTIKESCWAMGGFIELLAASEPPEARH